MHVSKATLAVNRNTCPVCKSTNRTILLSKPHSSEGFMDFIRFEKYYSKELYDGYANGTLGQLTFEVAECNDCSFLYLTEVLSDYGMGLLYNEWLDKDMLKVHYSKLPYSKYEETMLSTIKKHFRKKGKVNIMDFGAGYGNFCSISSKMGFSTYAFDLSADKNDYMNNMGVTIINNLEKFEGFFDFIWVNQVFEHLAEPLAVIAQLQQSLSKDGLLFIAVPDCSDAKALLQKEGMSANFFKKISPHQHINGFTNSTLQLLGKNAGLKPLGFTDFFKLYNVALNATELVFLVKKTIKNSGASTGLFFQKA